jgi:UDP-3-O-[3-hydroxymyristoyl] N-acetylglucosamine deacetylase
LADASAWEYATFERIEEAPVGFQEQSVFFTPNLLPHFN